MENAFKEIARKVTPTSEFLKAAKAASTNVFDKLKGCPNLSVARVLIGGSVGKQTAVSEKLFEIDFDLVLFVNKYQGQKEEDILKICLSELSKIPGFAPKSRTPISGNLLQFSLPVTVSERTTNVEFDLVIATNFGDQQVASTLEEIGENLSLNLNTIHRYGPSLSLETVALLRDLATGSTRDVVRVAKFWDKTLKKYDSTWKFISGRSYLIELIAIAANKDARDNSVYQGFLRFLKKMVGLGDLQVTFTERYNFYQIPASIREQRPLVMDPVNFYYNVAQGMGSENIKKYEAYAAKTELSIAAYLMVPMYPLTVDNFHQII